MGGWEGGRGEGGREGGGRGGGGGGREGGREGSKEGGREKEGECVNVNTMWKFYSITKNSEFISAPNFKYQMTI